MMFALLATAAALSTPLPRDEVVKLAATPAATPAATSAEVSALPTAPDPETTRYCFLNVEEDHIMRGKVCKTRAQWRWQGIDPLNYIGRNK